MAMSANDAYATGGGRRRRRGTLSEINVTPLVDVMLVLLIVFMISAPLMTAGVPVELPKTEAGSMQDLPEPITISIRSDGGVYVGEASVAFSDLIPRVQAIADGKPKPIYVRADGQAAYEVVAQVMAALSVSGFTSINLVTETGGPSSGATSEPQAP